MIERDKDGSSEDCPKVRLKDVIGRDEDGPSEVCSKVRPKDMIGQDEDGLSEVRPKFCPKDMIGRDGIWSYLLETLLIGWSDGSVFWKRF